MLAILIAINIATAAPPIRQTTAQCTANDLKDVACMKDCQHRDYSNGFSLPTGKCRCFDDFDADQKLPTTVPSNLRGKVINASRFFTIEVPQ